MMREIFLDIGELGWSFYLTAHLRWLKERRGSLFLDPAVMVIPGRECLYKDITKFIYKVPDGFLTDYDIAKQNRFTLYGISGADLEKYFNPLLVPMGYFVSHHQPFDCHRWQLVYVKKMIFKSYQYETKLKGKKEILVFPRYRKFVRFHPRNLPKIFYIDLINRLCDEFKDCVIRVMGTKSGAYDITEVKKNNYINFIGQTPNIQALIDRAQVAVGAIGSQSAPLKLMLLQGVPSFMIGHEEGRHTEVENWAKTRVGFYKIEGSQYNKFNDNKSIVKAVEFFKR